MIKMEIEALNLINEYTGCNIKKLKETEDIFRNLFNKWVIEYKDTGNDEAVYEEDDFLWNALTCYVHHTKGYINEMHKLFIKLNYEPKIILDFGSGIGLSTLHLANKFPNAEIIYCNIGYAQKKIFIKLLRKYPHKNIKIIKDINNIVVDTICCFELFEHIKEPEQMLDVLLKLNPTYLIEASSFKCFDAPGHYDNYIYKGNIITNTEMKQKFSMLVKSKGFEKIWKIYKHKCWNDRPTAWVNSTSKKLF